MTAQNDDNKKVVLLTKSGLEKIKEELDYFKNVRRKEVASRLKEAIAYGDLSENSEYEEAKNEQAFVEGRIIELEKMVLNSQIIEDDKRSTQEAIQIGTTITVQNITEMDEPETYTIVGSTEADPTEHKISNESPIGAALIGRKKGDVLSIKVPAGMFEYKVMKIK